MFARLLTIFLPVAFGVAALQTFPAHALGGPASVVIAQVQAGSTSGDGAATQEFISLYNNSGTAVDVTNWCLNNKAGTSFACLNAPDAATTLNLPSHAYALVASDAFVARYGGTDDAVFTTTNKTSGSLVGGSDTVSLLDANGNAVDSIAWTVSLAGGSVLTRSWANQAAGTMLDTDAASDFKKVTPLVVPASGVIETAHVVDVCANLDGAQTSVPDGYGLDGHGNCIFDVCPNLSGLQAAAPDKMKVTPDGRCLYDLAPLTLTELLPNATGSDAGNEFIEIFNPNATAVDLSLYRLQVGPNLEHTYAFATGMAIDAGGYKAFYDSEIGFSLLNTSSRARLVSIDGQDISDAPLYTDPADGQSWEFINDTWMFSNQPTPGLPNLLPTDDGETSDSAPVISAGLKPCAEGQYRNPDTNRCRAVVTTAGASDLKPCKDGQYRSEETNRCRSIATDAVTQKACADNQFRNPATGRCKQIASEEEVKDCGEGRERNPTTNRCRNVASTASGTTASGVRLAPAPASSALGWWAAGVVAAVALGYAAFEWRHEIGKWAGRRLTWAAPVAATTGRVARHIRSVRGLPARLLSRLRYNKK